MSAVNTDTDTILEVLNDKMDRDGNNLNQSAIDFDVVVEWQTPTAANNYTWYRKYASGWVEQGGAFPTTVDSAITITIPVEMADINYTLQLTRTFSAQNTSSANNGGVATWNKTTTSFMCWGKYCDTVADNWQVSGMAAA